MNSIATPDSQNPATTRRVVAYILLTMLVITAAVVTTHSPLSGNGLLTLLWTMSMFALASYWLRNYLDEHNYLENSTNAGLSANLVFSGMLLKG